MKTVNIKSLLGLVKLYREFEKALSCFQIPVFIRKHNDFHMPDKCANPLILIGAGTGISPFIGKIQVLR